MTISGDLSKAGTSAGPEDRAAISAEILAAIKGSKNILLHCHRKPDPDSVGSALAMKWAIEQMGKSATIIKGDSKLQKDFGSLPGYRDIVEKNFFEVDLSEYDVFISLDSAHQTQISDKAPMIFPPTLTVINIDHHVSNNKYGNINLIVPGYSSCCEVLFDLFEDWNIKLDHNIAACLFIGIYTDTGGFRYSATTAETMRKVALITAAVPDFPKVIFDMEYNNSLGKLVFDGLVLSSVKTYFNDSVGISAISYDELQQRGIVDEDMSSNIGSSAIVTVKGLNIGITMIEKEPNIVRVSLRSRDDHLMDVSLLAAKFGGGGHKIASGAGINKPLADAKQDMLDAIAEVFPELGSFDVG